MFVRIVQEPNVIVEQKEVLLLDIGPSYIQKREKAYLGMAHSALQVLNLDSPICQQAMADRKTHLTNDVQPVTEQKVIVAMYATT